MKKIFMDLETYSETPIKSGAYRYASDPHAEVLLWAWAVEDDEPAVWDKTAEPEMPAGLKAALEDVLEGRAVSVWHNGMMFDVPFLRTVMGIDIPNKAVVDTMVIAYQHGLPGSLEDIGTVLGLPVEQAKLKEGKRLVNLFCSPAPVSHRAHRYTRTNSPQNWETFKRYCAQDIVAMREIYGRMQKFNCTRDEREVQLADAAINARGMQIDIELAQKAFALDAEAKRELNRATSQATGGEVTAATQRDKLIGYIRKEWGIDLGVLSKDQVERHLDDPDLPEPVKDLLRLRLASAKTSAAKYERVLEAVSPDGRLRNTLQFRGASRTGRFAGRIFQPQNMARPFFKESEVEMGIEHIKRGVAAFTFEGELSELLASALRGLIIAPEGRMLAVADYSNIEGRVLAWISGESWKVKAFEDYDAGHGHDLYKLTYARTFNVAPETVTKHQRQMGKVLELALGYGGGVGAFVTFAKGYGIHLEDVAAAIRQAIDPVLYQQADDSWEWFVHNGRTQGLPREVFVPIDAVKRAWRAANPHIVALWSDVEQAMVKAVESPGRGFRINDHLSAKSNGTCLTVRLPAGRRLVYNAPRLPDDDSCAFSFLGVDQIKRKWLRIKTFGAKAVENIVQATACDILCSALVHLEECGLRPVMHVHDEIVCEVDAASAQAQYELMTRIMTNPPQSIYEGLPLSVDGFVGNRYKKKD